MIRSSVKLQMLQRGAYESVHFAVDLLQYNVPYLFHSSLARMQPHPSMQVIEGLLDCTIAWSCDHL